MNFGSLFYDLLFESESNTDVLKCKLRRGSIIKGNSNLPYFKLFLFIK